MVEGYKKKRLNLAEVSRNRIMEGRGVSEVFGEMCFSKARKGFRAVGIVRWANELLVSHRCPKRIKVLYETR